MKQQCLLKDILRIKSHFVIKLRCHGGVPSGRTTLLPVPASWCFASAWLAQGWLKVGSAFLEYHRPTKRSTSTSDLVLQRQRGGVGHVAFLAARAAAVFGALASAAAAVVQD